MARKRLAPALGIVFLLAGATAGAQGRDIDGRTFAPFAPAGAAHVLFFVASDCPVSNSYAPEIQRICKVYESKGVACSLAYEDVTIDGAAVRTHLDAFAYRGLPASIDATRALATRAKVSVTPSAVVIDSRGQVRYRGRINNRYASLGKPRQHVTMHDLTDALDAVVAGKSVARAETEAIGCFIAPAFAKASAVADASADTSAGKPAPVRK
jgi:hypothetical protein